MIEPSQTPPDNRPEHDWRDPSKPWNPETALWKGGEDVQMEHGSAWIPS